MCILYWLNVGVFLFVCSYMMCNSKEDLHRQANWPGVEGGARERLMDKLQGEYH